MEEPVLEGRPSQGRAEDGPSAVVAPVPGGSVMFVSRKQNRGFLWLTRFEAYIILGEGEFPSVDSLIPGYA